MQPRPVLRPGSGPRFCALVPSTCVYFLDGRSFAIYLIYFRPPLPATGPCGRKVAIRRRPTLFLQGRYLTGVVAGEGLGSRTDGLRAVEPMAARMMRPIPNNDRLLPAAATISIALTQLTQLTL